MTKKIKLSFTNPKSGVNLFSMVKKSILFLLILLIGIACVYCDDGDYITIVCEVRQIKPTFSINTSTFESGTVVCVTQDNMARYYGSYAVDVKLETSIGEYTIEDLCIVNACSCIEYKSGLYFRIDYTGRTVYPHTVASWTMKAVSPDLYGTVTLSFNAI